MLIGIVELITYQTTWEFVNNRNENNNLLNICANYTQKEGKKTGISLIYRLHIFVISKSS